MKNNKISINEKIVNACELPKDVIWGASIISITGNREIYIENFKNIKLISSSFSTLLIGVILGFLLSYFI